MPLNCTLKIAETINLHYMTITTIILKALKNYRLVKKQENMTHNQEKNQLIEIDPVMTEMMKLADKDIKTAIKMCSICSKI